MSFFWSPKCILASKKHISIFPSVSNPCRLLQNKPTPGSNPFTLVVTSQEMHIGSLCILTQMSQRIALSPETCNSIIVELFNGILTTDNSQTRKQIALAEAFMFLNLLVSTQTISKQEDPQATPLLFPPEILKRFAQHRHRDDITAAIYGAANVQNIDSSGLIGCLYRSIFNSAVASTLVKRKHRDAIISFALQFLQSGVSDNQSRLTSKSCIAICLAAFDAICSSEDVHEAPGKLAIVRKEH